MKKKKILDRIKEEETIIRTVKRRNANRIFRIGRRIAFEKMLLKERQKGREDEEEEVRSYWMILRKTEDTRF